MSGADLKKKLRTIKSNLGYLQLLNAVETDELVCTCGEPWEITQEARADLSGEQLMAFQIEGSDLVKCPACNPVKDPQANAIRNLLVEVQEYESVEDVLDLISEG